ncbi:ATPase [Actinoplanes sp. ATCC 53533]|uniref:ATP-binding protein n=1 Tax=Actinoplanes sp. ATCC 53533 TaxID=1288362 RepID=UPI000F78BBA0|nr:ATP-binding protein [Actinoplanes sp. ATCC 53533]RSM48931.1 ATPase [Actinoplanes sp. ATCC 53533]
MSEPASRGASPSPADLLTRQFGLDGLVTLRHDLERCAAQHGLAGLELYRFVVAVNELTTNAVRHGGGSGQLALWRTADRLHCRVTDRGKGLPAGRLPHRPPPDAVGGRGLWLAHHSVEQLVIDSDGRGTSITVSTRV